MAVLRTTRVEEPAASGSSDRAGAPVPRPSGAGLWVGNFPSSEINCLEGSPHRDTMVASCSLMASMDDVPNLRDLHVLVLDDHQDTLDVFSTALRACNANVFTARTARDAVTSSRRCGLTPSSPTWRCRVKMASGWSINYADCR